MQDHDQDQERRLAGIREETDRYEPIATHADLQARLAGLTPPQLRYLEARLGAIGRGVDQVHVATEEANIGRTSIYKWENLAEIEDLVRALRVDGALISIGRERMRRLAAQSIDTLERNLEARFGKDQIQAATEILDRAGLAKTVHVSVEQARPAEESAAYISRLQDARRLLDAGEDAAQVDAGSTSS